MNAVIIYDDLASAAQATAMLRNAVRRAGEVLQWNVKLWRLEKLSRPADAETGLREAMDAHLILLILHDPTLLPVSLRNWLEQWATRRQVQEAALAVWSESNRNKLSAGFPEELSELAARHCLNCIPGDDRATDVESASCARYAQANMQITIPRNGASRSINSM